MATTNLQDFFTTNLPAFEQIERELDITITDEQRSEIALLTFDGTDFYEAFDAVVES